MSEVEQGAVSGAAQGAMIGSIVPGIGTLVGAGVGGALGAVGGKGAKKSRGAAQAAAIAQQREAQRQYKEQSGILNKASVMGMASMDKAIGQQEKNLARQEQMISQIDPTIIEASQQALKLLRGETSSTLAPLQRQRDMQRQKLMNSLREQLGPGAETSTAGIQAMNRFDAESSNLFAGAQQQALGNLGNISSQFSSQRPDIGREIGNMANFGMNKAGYGFQLAEGLRLAGAGKQATAGAQYTGQMMQGQYQQAQANQLMQTGGMLAGSYLSGGLGGGTTSPTSTPGMTANANPMSTGQMNNYNFPSYPTR